MVTTYNDLVIYGQKKMQMKEDIKDKTIRN